MSAYRLIDEFAVVGIRLTAENGLVVFEGPREMLTPKRIEELRRHKAELLAALTVLDADAFGDRSAIIEFDGGLSRQDAETLAALEQGHADAGSLHRESARRWTAEIERLITLHAVSLGGTKALKQALAFIADGWALQAVRLGWGEVELFGGFPRAPWQRLDRKGAAFDGAVQAITQDAMIYVDGRRRYRATVNNDGGAVLIWEIAAGVKDGR